MRTSAAKTMEGISVENQPELSKRGVAISLPLALVAAEDWIDQPLLSGRVLPGRGDISAADGGSV